jgi:hypothetical protein
MTQLLSAVAFVLLASRTSNAGGVRGGGGSCAITAPDPSNLSGSCYSFNLLSLARAAGNGTPWVVYDNSSYHVPYEVASPCSLASTAPCANAASVAQSSSYALIGSQGSGKSVTCYALGGAPTAGGGLPTGTHATLLPPAVADGGGAPGGVSITITGGEGGRTLIYNVLCDPDAPVDQGPSSVAWTSSHSLTYPVVWKHPAGCGTLVQGDQCPAAPKPPTPTATQLAYQDAEIVAIVCFQMDTYAGNDGDPGCNRNNWNSGVNTSSPATFNVGRAMQSVCLLSLCAVMWELPQVPEFSYMLV